MTIWLSLNQNDEEIKNVEMQAVQQDSCLYHKNMSLLESITVHMIQAS